MLSAFLSDVIYSKTPDKKLKHSFSTKVRPMMRFFFDVRLQIQCFQSESYLSSTATPSGAPSGAPSTHLLRPSALLS